MIYAYWFIIVIILIITPFRQIAFHEMNQEVSQEMEIQMRRIQVNYAVDSATEEVRENTVNLGLDYADFEYMQIDPNEAYFYFTNYLGKMLGYPQAASSKGQTVIAQEYINAFGVVTYDGVYWGRFQEMGVGQNDAFIFSEKIPYIYRNGIEMYALNLSNIEAIRFNGSLLRRVSAPIPPSQQKIIISDTILESLIKQLYFSRDPIESRVYIPADTMSTTEIVPLNKTTVLVYMSNEGTFRDSTIANQLVVGGSNITHNEPVGIYMRNGVRQYAFVSKIPNGITPTDILDTAIEAAERGYYFDLTSVQ